MVELDFLADKTPVMIYDMDKVKPDVAYEIHKNLSKVYPDIIALPRGIHIEWWTKEQLEEIRRIIDGNI